MVVDPCDIGNGRNVALQGMDKMLPRHSQGQCPIAQGIAVVRFHGLVQHDLFIRGVCLARQLPGKRGLRQKGVGHRPRQGQCALPRILLVSQVVDDQGYLHRVR